MRAMTAAAAPCRGRPRRAATRRLIVAVSSAAFLFFVTAATMPSAAAATVDVQGASMPHAQVQTQVHGNTQEITHPKGESVAAVAPSVPGASAAAEGVALYQGAIQQLESLDPSRLMADDAGFARLDEPLEPQDEWQNLLADALHVLARHIFPQTNWGLGSFSRLWSGGDSAGPEGSSRSKMLYDYESASAADSNSIVSSDPPALKRAKAVMQLHAAAYEHGNTDSLKALADIHLYGKYGHLHNTTAAFVHYKALADKGNATAQRMVGVMYATGVGVRRSYPNALVYASFAALDGDILAEQMLGYWHIAGIGMPKSCESAAWHYSRVAAANVQKFRDGPPGGRTLTPSHRSLASKNGGLYGEGASGGGNPTNRKKSKGSLSQEELLTFYRLQAETGDAVAQFMVGQVYYQGTETIPKDYAKAMHFFLMAVKQHPGVRAATAPDASKSTQQLAHYAAEAVGYIGTMHWRGEGVRADPVKARKWFEQGILWGNAASYNGLGMMYMKGDAGLERDEQKAVKYLSEAVNRNSVDGMINLAEYFMRMPQFDMSQITSLLAHPSQKGNILAYYHMGRMLLKDQGASTNCKSAVMYFKNVAETGDWMDDALPLAEAAMKRGDLETAFVHYLFSAERGHVVAQANAAWLLDQGLFDPRAAQILHPDEGNISDPYETALNLWNRAANQGSEDARVKVGDYYYLGIGVGGGNRGDANKAAETEAVSTPSRRQPWYERLTSAAFLLPNVHVSEPVYERAAIHYQVAAESEYSSFAMFNLGYMHEHGLGVARDYHLAKRWYDMSLSTNPSAYLAVNIALAKLSVKWAFAQMLDAIGFESGVSSDTAATRDASSQEDEPEPETPPILTEQEDHDTNTPSQTGYENTIIAVLLGIASLLYFWRQRIEHQRAALENLRARARAQTPVRPEHANQAPIPAIGADLANPDDNVEAAPATGDVSGDGGRHDTLYESVDTRSADAAELRQRQRQQQNINAHGQEPLDG